MKIMLVDDEADVRFIEKLILEKEGYEVIEADSGEECIEKLKTEKVDLILLDVMMPGLNGWETCKRIKENESTKDILVIMVTVKGSDEDTTERLQCSQSNGHVSKPIIKEDLIRTIKGIAGTA